MVMMDNDVAADFVAALRVCSRNSCTSLSKRYACIYILASPTRVVSICQKSDFRMTYNYKKRERERNEKFRDYM